MDSIFALVGADFVLLAADCTAARSIIAYKHDEDKIRALDSHKLVAAAGPQSDTVRFVEYIQRNIALNEFRTGLKMSVAAAAAYVRTELAAALRKAPYQANLLIGGCDASGPSLVFMDYLASSAPVNYGAQGYAGYFVTSLFDRHWRAGMTRAEALALARMCIKEIRTRMTIASPRFVIKIVGADGISVVAADDAPAADAAGRMDVEAAPAAAVASA